MVNEKGKRTMFPTSFIKNRWKQSLVSFIKNPLISLLFYGFNFFFVYLPFIASLELEEGGYSLVAYPVAVFFCGIFFALIKHKKGEQLFLKQKNRVISGLIGFMIVAWAIGLLITVLLDLYLLAAFAYNSLMALF